MGLPGGRSVASMLKALTTTCVLGVAWLSYTRGHAFLEVPASRNFLASSPANMNFQWGQVEYCQHCLNMGGVGTVSGNTLWPGGNRAGNSICGDPHNANPPQYLIGTDGVSARRYNRIWAQNMFGGSYTMGGTLQGGIRFSTYHRGAVQLQLCVISNWTLAREQQLLTNQCFEQNILLQASTGLQPGQAWLYLNNSQSTAGGLGEGWQGLVTSTWQLPAGVSCNFVNDNTKCVLRMYYLTGNTCKQPNVPTEFQNTLSQFLGTCGQPNTGYPEEFRNCADIRIMTNGGPTATSPTPTSPQPPTPASPTPKSPTPSSPIPASPRLTSPAPNCPVCTCPSNAAAAQAEEADPTPGGAEPQAEPSARIRLTRPQMIPAPLPQNSPLFTCKAANSLRCFCKGRVEETGSATLTGGFVANPWDASGQTYLSCDGAGRVQIYWCPAKAAFVQGQGCQPSSDTAAPGFQGWQCVPNLPFAIKQDPKGDLQCWSEDMTACSSVCNPAATAASPYSPPSSGTITCGLVLRTITGQRSGGYKTQGHWCRTGCQSLGGCPGRT